LSQVINDHTHVNIHGFGTGVWLTWGMCSSTSRRAMQCIESSSSYM
jgi:hypothetical protein